MIVTLKMEILKWSKVISKKLMRHDVYGIKNINKNDHNSSYRRTSVEF